MIRGAEKGNGIVPEKKKYIDAVKGFCILLVIMSHADALKFPGGGYLRACYMQVYFILGGITYTDRHEETFGMFCARKAKRLLLPYYIYSLFLLIINAVSSYPDISDNLIYDLAGIFYARSYLFWDPDYMNNIFLLNFLSGQLWFLPAMFLTYLLFWALVKVSKEKRMALIVIYFCVNIATSFLPVLLPWSLDTVFITSILMYLGYCSKESIGFIERLNVQSICKPKWLLSLFCMILLYCITVHVNGWINTAARMFGDFKVMSIFLYIVIGCVGTFIYLTVFSVCENTRFLKSIAECFEYLGHRTIELLATHILIFAVCNKVFSFLPMPHKTICRIVASLIVGIAYSNIVDQVTLKRQRT